ncbi:fas apoptotic inhibitory molecule 1 isoform X1 [Zootoca vivipara]|uniref:fas apoptotic inhibitory molecule 1 isoform X1 n=3 Tax=Lacertinae TaxID=162266 RepID=UPI00158FC561|nr:fas apoptotic inhibitory molecule 1 isoform X1 [Zootoca vivipara]
MLPVLEFVAWTGFPPSNSLNVVVGLWRQWKNAPLGVKSNPWRLTVAVETDILLQLGQMESGYAAADALYGISSLCAPPSDPQIYLDRMTDLVAIWEVGLSDGIHKIEFEHGTTSGKRVVYVDGKEIMRKEWMFKLVGKETFTVGTSKTKATINIDAVSGFAYEYTLEINGKSLTKYMENRSKTTSTWMLHLDGTDFRVVLEKDTMDVWCNGKKVETAGEFVDDGTETHFSIGKHNCCIKAVSSGKRREGILHMLVVDDEEITAPL